MQTFRNTVVILLTLAAAYIFVSSLRIIVVLVLAIIIASALRPLIMTLHRYGVPIGAGIVLMYGVLAVCIVLLGVAILPPVVSQVAGYLGSEDQLANRIIIGQRWVERIISDVTQSQVSLVAPDEVREAVREFVREFERTMPSVLDDLSATLADAVLIFVIGAYWLTSHTNTTAFITHLFRGQYREQAQRVIDQIEDTLGGYVRGMVVITVIVGVLNLAAMMVFGVPNAPTLTFVIALSTAIPMIGGVIGMGIAILITLVASPQHLLTVIAITFIVQQIESLVLSPRVMSNRVGLNPLLVIIYTAIGFMMLGVVGALIAVPIMSVVHILLVNLVIEPYKGSLRPFQTEEGLPVIRDDTALPKTPILYPTPSE
jgi:predicted PurR-regulated permease PerM